MVSHWSLSNSKSPQVTKTLLSILAVLNNVVVWMVSTRPPTSKSSSPFNNPLVTAPKAPITISIIVTFMFQSFFTYIARSWYLSFFSLLFQFLRVFNEIRVTASLVMFPGLIKELKQNLKVQWSEWSQFFFWSQVYLVSFPGFGGPFQRLQLQLLSLSLSCPTALSALWYIYIIIIMCLKHGIPWLSIAIRLYHPSLSAGLLGYILISYRTAVDKF